MACYAVKTAHVHITNHGIGMSTPLLTSLSLLRDVLGTPHPEVFLRRPVAPGEIFGAPEVELVVNDVAEAQQLIHDGDAPSR